MNNDLTHQILNCAFSVHSALGPGLLESAYQHCLAHELTEQGLKVELEKPLPLEYKEVRLDCGYRVDLFVQDEVIVEVKAVETLHDIHLAQILTYLKLMKKDIGLLLNFNVTSMKQGIKRVINTKK